jgi:hypothetical protein
MLGLCSSTGSCNHLRTTKQSHAWPSALRPASPSTKITKSNEGTRRRPSYFSHSTSCILLSALLIITRQYGVAKFYFSTGSLEGPVLKSPVKAILLNAHCQEEDPKGPRAMKAIHLSLSSIPLENSASAGPMRIVPAKSTRFCLRAAAEASGKMCFSRSILQLNMHGSFWSRIRGLQRRTSFP